MSCYHKIITSYNKICNANQELNKSLARGVKASSVIHYHAVIHRTLKYAVKIDLISVNPADKWERPMADKVIGA